MVAPTSPTASEPTISADALAEAAERRTGQATPQLTAAQLAAEHEHRQKFRRLIDPGITRPNPRDKAFSSLKTLLTISDNLLRDLENPKYQRFKPTNTLIKRELVDRKGALEYAIELGFRPEVVDFQPYYTFNKRNLQDLRVGNTILKEYLAVEIEKEERSARAKKSEKESHDAVAEKVKLAFMDDRKSRMLRDEMEREQRGARAAAAAQREAAKAAKPRTNDNAMPGGGQTLSGDTGDQSEDDYFSDSEGKDR